MRFIKYIIYHVQVHKNIPFYMYTYIEILHLTCTDILYSIYRVQIYRNIPYIMYRYAEIECIDKFLFINRELIHYMKVGSKREDG